jgi:Cu+-exporting ATPase
MTTKLHIEEMTCQNCARHVREAIQSLPNVDSVAVVLEKAEAVVKWKDENISEV